MAELEAGLEQIRRSPADRGSVELIVARPAEGERELLEIGVLDEAEGLIGDRWSDDDPRTQLTLTNARAVALVAIDPDRRALAGDQLYVDLDLGGANLPPGTRLSVGDAVIEVTDVPHTGCGKFIKRFGVEAQKFVNSPAGRELNLRGVNARVITGGAVRVGDTIAKVVVG
jgi:MOSC domain-containing protein